jgi:hypothetical protein
MPETMAVEKILSVVKKLKPRDKLLLWQKLESDIEAVTAKIRKQAQGIRLDRISDVSINYFIQKMRKSRAQSGN